LVALAGGQDALGQPGSPSRQVSWDEIAAAEPDVLLVMPCGFTLDRTIQELRTHCPALPWEQLPAVRNERVFALDGNAHFSRPGSRLIEGLEILEALVADEDQNGRLPPGAHRVTWLRTAIAR
jgi:iron complex transport system substrate-binding protein